VKDVRTQHRQAPEVLDDLTVIVVHHFNEEVLTEPAKSNHDNSGWA
jgi:hypothetical protein